MAASKMKKNHKEIEMRFFVSLLVASAFVGTIGISNITFAAEPICGTAKKIQLYVEHELGALPILGGVDETGESVFIHVTKDKRNWVLTRSKDGQMCILKKGALTFSHIKRIKELLKRR